MKRNHTDRNCSVACALFLALALLLTVAAQAQQINKHYNPAPFAKQEVLRYSVHYSFIRLGSIELRQRAVTKEGRSCGEVRLIARTASGVPFINLDMKETALLLREDPRCMDFRVEKSDDIERTRHYRYDEKSGTFSVEEKEKGKAIEKKSRQESRRCFDAMGFLMYLRGLAGSGVRETVPTLMDFEIVDTRMACHREQEEMDVDAFDDDVMTYRTSLSAGWEDESVGGMQGDIEVWCLASGSAIPVYAEIDLALGSIDIELEKYSRKDMPAAVSEAKRQGGAGSSGSAGSRGGVDSKGGAR
ncbi:DUF3108 domain-containing protein [bacterium]|nr:DUF3108 domain-containing protein [bacterium]